MLVLVLAIIASPVLAATYYPSTYMRYGERYAPYIDTSSTVPYSNVYNMNTSRTYGSPYGTRVQYGSAGIYGTYSAAQCLYKNARGECMIEQYIDPGNYRPVYSAAPRYPMPVYDRDYLDYERRYSYRDRYESVDDDDYDDCDSSYRSSRYRRNDCRNIWDYFDN